MTGDKKPANSRVMQFARQFKPLFGFWDLARYPPMIFITVAPPEKATSCLSPKAFISSP